MAGAASAHQAATASREQNSQQRAGRTRRTSADPQRAQQGATAAAADAPAALQTLSRLQHLADASPQVAQLRRLQALADGRFAPVAQLAGDPEEEERVQGKFATAQRQPQLQQAPRANNTGLPDQLKSGIESLSGLSMDHVRVHYNSSQPAQLNALAYTQGSDIRLAPGQERHLPHEAWHVVQQAQGRVQPTLQAKGQPINDDRGLEHEADVMGDKALQIKTDPGSHQMQKKGQAAQTSPLIQGMFEWAELVETLGSYAYHAMAALGVWVFYKIVQMCFSKGQKSKEELKEALDHALDNLPKKNKDDSGLPKNPDVQDLLAPKEAQKQQEKEFQNLIPPEIQSPVSNSGPKEQSEAVKAVPSVEKGGQEKPSSKEQEVVVEKAQENVQASSRAENYLAALRNTNMWGGYAEANAIATDLRFSSRIFTPNAGRLRLLADIGNGPRRQLSLLWTGNHYQVIAGNLNDRDAMPAITHDPVGDGNCMFEAIFYIMRDGGGHVSNLLQNEQRRTTEIRNMRRIAANMLAQGDPIVLNYLGEEMHAARKKSDLSNWKNVSGALEISQIKLYEQLLMSVYKNFPPKNYYIEVGSKASYFVKRNAEDSRSNISVFLRDNEELKEILKDEKNSSTTRSQFKDWLDQDIGYRKSSAQGKQKEELPKGYDKHSFKASDSAKILEFLEDKVSTSLNLVNCSQHLDGMEGRTELQYDKLPVYHYSRGRDQWGQPYSVFYVLLDDDLTYVKIIGIGSHVGKSSASYKMAWGIGSQNWVASYEFSL